MTEERVIYSHRQPAYVMFFFIAAISVMVFYRQRSSGVELCILLSVSFILLVLFHSQKVTVTDAGIKVSMGAGIIRKRISLGSIRESRIVKNRWYMGWGIRIIPGGMMFNVSGLSAVELLLERRNVFRIGTDDPVNLDRAIRDALSGDN